MAWKVFTGEVRGYEVPGDPDVPPTKWWNHLFLLLFKWRMVSVFLIKVDKPYYVGFIPKKGKARLCTKKLTGDMFRVRNEHESCTFFAVDEDGKEIGIICVSQTDKDDNIYDHVPLL